MKPAAAPQALGIVEHGRVEAGLGSGEIEIGAAHPLQGGARLRPALVPSAGKPLAEKIEAAAGEFAHQLLPVGEMPVGRCRRDADTLSRLG
jgi:hypothetical protein